MRKLNRRNVLFLLPVLGLVAAACGSDDDAEPAVTPAIEVAETTPASASETTPASASETTPASASETAGAAESDTTLGAADLEYEVQGISDDTIKVAGHQLGGSIAPGFEDLDLAVKGVFEKVNAAGGVHGRMIEYLPFESEFDPAAGTTLCREAVEQEQVFAFVGDNPISAGDGCYDLLGERRIPVIGTDGVSFRAFAHPTAFNMTSDIFNFYRVNGYYAAQLDPLPEKLGGVFTGGSPAFEATARSTMDYASELGVPEVLDAIVLPVTQAEFTDVVSRLKSEDVDTLILAYDPSGILPFMGAMAQQGYFPRIILGMQDHDVRLTEAMASVLGPDQELYLPAQTYLPETGGGLYGEYAADVASIEPDGLVFSQGFQAWAGAKLFVEAMEAIGPEPTRSKLIEYISGLDAYESGLQPEPFDFTAVGETDRFVPKQFFLAQYDAENTTWVVAPGALGEWQSESWTPEVPDEVR